MPLDLSNYKQKTVEAVQAFWGNRAEAFQKQAEAGKIDAGERSKVTAGKNMDGFVTLIADLVEANGLSKTDIHLSRKVITLPGYFRPTKLWDLLVVRENRLIAAIELKSQVGSFGNNFNNRTKEAIGTAHDFWTAFRDNAFGGISKPFVGWLMLVEDAPESNASVRDAEPHFQIFPEFKGASYLERYNILCQKLMKEQLYTAACIITSPRTASATGEYRELSQLTSMEFFVSSFAGHIATEAVRHLNR